jgi:hypothetical protein
MNNGKDLMPDRNSPEFEEYAKRVMKLSTKNFFALFDHVGIKFMSRTAPDGIATYDELKDDPKDLIVEVLDEADSRRKVDEFLRQNGV